MQPGIKTDLVYLLVILESIAKVEQTQKILFHRMNSTRKMTN